MNTVTATSMGNFYTGDEIEADEDNSLLLAQEIAKICTECTEKKCKFGGCKRYSRMYREIRKKYGKSVYRKIKRI